MLPWLDFGDCGLSMEDKYRLSNFMSENYMTVFKFAGLLKKNLKKCLHQEICIYHVSYWAAWYTFEVKHVKGNNDKCRKLHIVKEAFWLVWLCLKTLFNIVEDRLKKLWNFDNYLCCIMMFRRVNRQPGMQKFWNWCSHYGEIYDWISPLNKRSDSPFIQTQ